MNTLGGAQKRSFVRLRTGFVILLLFIWLSQALSADELSTRIEQTNVGISRFEGRYCAGTGDESYLRLIDESFDFFHANPRVPNLAMLYRPEWDTFEEGAGWGAWWIQNSYGFAYAAMPFLREPWFSILQRSWDLHWDKQGDGKRAGLWGGSTEATPFSAWVAPDGCLGDCARPGEVIYKQGDGKFELHDWFYEATAAGVVAQAELLLASRNAAAIAHYLPKMERACDAIERTRDPKNNLFLVGPACNLLAPSFGGARLPDGTFGKSYLAGLSITYLAALDRMIELQRLGGASEKLATYERRQKITRDSLQRLLTPEGYFVKSIEANGTKHGVLGQLRFGYLEGVANADAVALRVADAATAKAIYRRISTFPEIRPFDFLLTNAPSLDDMYVHYGDGKIGKEHGFFRFGDWVNGGAWGTVEARAILMYYRLSRFDDIRRSAERAMKWAKNFRMDAPWAQRGENKVNPWSDSGNFHAGGVSVMIDNFGIPAATIRGLFDYEYRSDRLILRPRFPVGILEYVQKEPIRFGDKLLYLTYYNRGGKTLRVTINGRSIPAGGTDEVELLYTALPQQADIVLSTGEDQTETISRAALQRTETSATTTSLASDNWPQLVVLTAMQRVLAEEADARYDQAFVNETIAAFAACRERISINPEATFRPITADRRKAIQKSYERAALVMYDGLIRRMQRYGKSKDPRQQRIAQLFDAVRTKEAAGGMPEDRSSRP